VIDCGPVNLCHGVREVRTVPAFRFLPAAKAPGIPLKAKPHRAVLCLLLPLKSGSGFGWLAHPGAVAQVDPFPAAAHAARPIGGLCRSRAARR
jgi:hypothetical protein